MHKFFLPSLLNFKASAFSGGESSVVQHLLSLPQESLWVEILLAIFVGSTTGAITYVAVRVVKNNRYISRVFLGDV